LRNIKRLPEALVYACPNDLDIQRLPLITMPNNAVELSRCWFGVAP